MLRCPEAQKTAQEELDSVLGKNQLPEFADENSLPYCGALVKELYRWRPVASLAIPRYRIPAGSVILPNVWAILHDERVYPEPEEYKPERFLRFLKEGKLDVELMDPTVVGAVGFGRRICLGRFLAMKSVLISVMSILASMDITHVVDEHGNIIESKGNVRGTVNAVLPFKCSMEPRSAEVVGVIKSSS
ncbi:cytochrome P450 [Athelia psychrophila]|uniref:Cytochrome P450 n=1 Tax=Athelia psychrophila TaxID=1759441 RepID=A0A166WDP7_9AGAM|nr:cytochrome P450 [Fibularhizoctonia sp. CBS 109695]